MKQNVNVITDKDFGIALKTVFFPRKHFDSLVRHQGVLITVLRRQPEKVLT